jgi:hypothetical protein
MEEVGFDDADYFEEEEEEGANDMTEVPIDDEIKSFPDYRLARF